MIPDENAAIDFTTVEVWTKTGLVTFYLLFAMELKTRRVHFVGSTTSPHEPWMKQAACELTNFEDGFLINKQYLIMDRDIKFCESFRSPLLLRFLPLEPDHGSGEQTTVRPACTVRTVQPVIPLDP